MENKEILAGVLLIIAVIFISLICVNLKRIRDITARHFNTISVINAKNEMEMALAKAVPEGTFEFASGSYTDLNGNDDDQSFTGNYMVNDQEDNIISVVYSDKGYDSIWQGNVQVTVLMKAYERKCGLVTRLSQDYTNVIRNEAWRIVEPYVLSESDVTVKSFYQDPNYEKPLPDGLEFGMKFDKDFDLDYEFRILIQTYDTCMEQQISEKIIQELRNMGFVFYQYNFMFVSNGNITHYIYDESGSFIEGRIEEIQ